MFEWKPRSEESFQQLKNIITSAPALKIADPNKYLWCVLMHVIKDLEEFLCKTTTWYAMSQETLKEHEKNYATHDLELAAIVHALKM